MSATPNRQCETEEWAALIKSYLKSGLTQKAFCTQQGKSFHGLRHHCQRSPLFRGNRRQPRGDGFQRVTVLETASRVAQTWTIRCGDRVRIDCPPGTPVEAIVRLARRLADASCTLATAGDLPLPASGRHAQAD